MAREGGEPGEIVDERPSGFDQARRFGPVAILAASAVIFVLQNTDETHFEFLWLDFQWPLWVVLLMFAAIGAVVFWGWAARRRRRHRRDD